MCAYLPIYTVEATAVAIDWMQFYDIDITYWILVDAQYVVVFITLPF